MNATASPLWARLDVLVSLFREIETTRMRGVPLLHPGLRVEAVGFEPEPAGTGAVGILVTPWFMNLLRIPLDPAHDVLPALRPGATRRRTIGCEAFEFIGAHEEPFGPYEACSLFSPMLEFEDQAAAHATACAVLRLLREPPAPPSPEPSPLPARRSFLFGREAR
jgi:[NiFe] hydrogenase assembly HybE family chaperone